MKGLWAILPGLLFLDAGLSFAELKMESAYHDDADGIDHRLSEKVPGETFTFLANGTDTIGNNDPVTLYILTMNQFAGEREEHVFLRWWNGEKENWIEGIWQKNIVLGEGENSAGSFHGQPFAGSILLDLWKFEIPPDITRPGDNYYVIQLKASEADRHEVLYLLREPAGEFGGKNDLGQAWTAAPEGYAGHDWKVIITE